MIIASHLKVVKILVTMVMVSAMMETTKKPAFLMEVIVVDLMPF